jgi:predicted TIM-barrel fold metal-dependent hydrolase
MELSFTFGYLGHDEIRDMLLSHPSDRLLFGTDSPWTGQQETLDAVRALRLGEALERRILSENAQRLLGA